MSQAFDDDFNALLEEFNQGEPENPYEEFSLLSNPFPGEGQFILGICVDQDDVKDEFKRKLREFHLNNRSTRLTIVGRTGAGKTTLLRFFEERLSDWRNINFFTVFVQMSKSGYLDVHPQIISQLGALFYIKLFNAVRQKQVDLTSLPADLSGISPELVHVLKKITSYQSTQLSIFEAENGPNSLRNLDDWLQGRKLSAADKKLLGNITVEVGKSSTVAIKFLTDLIRILRHAKLFSGLVIFLDEFEQIVSDVSGADRTRYAQDIRNLFDSLAEGIVFIIATAPVADSLERVSPALNRRLGSGVSIEPIKSEELALEYAKAYMYRGREEFARRKNRLIESIKFPKSLFMEDHPFYPLTKSTILEVYNNLREQQGADVVPGDFLPALNLRLYQRVYQQT